MNIKLVEKNSIPFPSLFSIKYLKRVTIINLLLSASTQSFKEIVRFSKSTSMLNYEIVKGKQFNNHILQTYI